MVNIVPSYHPIARAKLSGQAKQRDALVFGHDFAPNIYFFGHDFIRIKPTLFWWVPAAVVARAMITHDD